MSNEELKKEAYQWYRDNYGTFALCDITTVVKAWQACAVKYAPQNAAGDNWNELKKALLNFPEAVELVAGYYRERDIKEFIETTFRQFSPPTATADLLPNLEKSTANWDKIKDKDRWLSELRGHGDNPTASKHPKDSGIVRHPLQDILDRENKTGKWSKSKLLAALMIDNDNLKQTVKELTEQLKQKG